jgi:2-oxoglutarate dehydrogenase E2 component (dihydrolipoamide succinyltransferase)
MTVEVKVPEIGESITEVYIGAWAKSEGEAVEQDEPLVELESEKATLDLPAPADGVLAKIVKQSGETAQVGDVIAMIEDRGDDRPTKKKSETSAAGESAPKDQGGATTESAADSKQVDGKKKPRAPATLHEKRQKRPAAERDQSIDRQEGQAEEQPHRAAEPAQRPSKPSRPPTADAESQGVPSRREERVPMSPIRRRIAQRLVEAQQNAALLTTFNEIDMTAVKELRARRGEAFERKHGVRLGFMSFFIKASLVALDEFPELNGSIDDDDIIYHRYFDIGVAVSSEKGLVVPVLRDVDRMNFAQIERAIDDLANRARDGQLKVEELQGGTFTITNGGVFGSLLSTPIVNPPQSGVLGMHAILERPVAVHGEVVVRPMMYVALTYDHRLADGRVAVSFLKRIKECIEDPSRLLLDL